jgi:hypothetical protein
MLSFTAGMRIFVGIEPVDMRGSFNALAGAVRGLGLEPTDGHLYLFFNRRRRLCKMIFFDGSGLCLFCNQLVSHYTSFDRTRGPWLRLGDERSAAARSLSRSHRLQCFAGWVAGSS